MVDESVVRYQSKFTYDPEAPTLLGPFMQPFGPACFLPQDTRGNNEVAVAARVQKLASSITEVSVHVEMALMEAGNHIIDVIGRHTLFPVTEDEVRENQPRPSQQHILDQGTLVASLADPERRIFAFKKAEPAQKVAAPRIISPDEPAHKLLWSRFMIPLHKALVKHFGVDGEGWYAPGMTPKSIAARVAEVCASGKATMSDGDKWDSTICPVERAWEGNICYGVFHPSTHLELEKGLKASHCNPVALEGVLYEQLCGRGSGFADTTVGNTLFNYAKDYVAARTERLADGFREPADARKVCGIYMGDDSLSRYIGTDHLVATGKAVGLVLEVEQKQAPEPGVNFISRFYGPYVWTGDLSSTCDLPRICSKIHVCDRVAAGQEQTPRVKLQQRMIGLYLSDRNTPLIGAYATMVIKVFGRPDVILRDLASYYAGVEDSEQFPNLNATGWMEDFWTQRCPDLMLDLVQPHLDHCVFDPRMLFKAPLFFRPVPVTAPEGMVTDVLSAEVGLPFPAVAKVVLTSEEREDLREAVDIAAKSGSLKVEPAMVPVGDCRDCAKRFLAPLLSTPQRAKLEQGLPFRCRDCAGKAKLVHEAKFGKDKGKSEATGPAKPT